MGSPRLLAEHDCVVTWNSKHRTWFHFHATRASLASQSSFPLAPYSGSNLLPNRPQQLSSRMVHALVLSRQPDAEIAEAELDIAGCSELVRLAHGLGLRWRKWCLEELDFLEGDDDLVGG